MLFVASQDPGITLDALAERLGVPVRTVVKDVSRLQSAGLLDLGQGGVRATLGFADALASQLARSHGLDSRLEPGSRLANKFTLGRLGSLPKDRHARSELAALAATLVPEEGIGEPELNSLLALYFDDFAALRRLMVDEGAVERESSSLTYFRTSSR
ncbi:DUF2087 domain-containing protein [Nocardioides zeae]|uniref:DUF2087 domain-containing protein n=1 Tax=Nocardioides zeae TaxID=1457234 RepID=A0A6P0HQF4_9ACTN|nr:DUF2087 domain-containing protein [Nocardioides zeae]